MTNRPAGFNSIQKCDGNVLFLILIAVALFAALSYAVSNSSRSGGQGATKEQIEAKAATLLQYASAMESAINRMRLSNGCTLEQISFDNPFTIDATSGGVLLYPDDSNSNSPLDKRCHVFATNGGGMIAQVFDNVASKRSGLVPANTNPGQVSLVKLGVPGVGTSLNELVLRIEYVDVDVCNAINAKLSIPTNDVVCNFRPFFGSWSGTGSCSGTGIPLSTTTFCAWHNGTSKIDSHFHHVVAIR